MGWRTLDNASASYDIKQCTEDSDRQACDAICTNSEGTYGYWDSLAACIAIRNLPEDKAAATMLRMSPVLDQCFVHRNK